MVEKGFLRSIQALKSLERRYELARKKAYTTNVAQIEACIDMQAEATTNKGGGKAGLIDRLGGAAGHAKFICPLCKMQAPSIKNMQEHHEVRYSKWSLLFSSG